MIRIIILILVIIIILISVAFLTLIERKLLGYIHLRKGPNKVGIIGLIQPFSDAIKLLSKELYFINKFNFIYYLISPIFILVLILIIWLIYPLYTNLISMNIGLIYLICCLRFRVYGLIISGWSSNSSYSILGALRSLAQSISYEVRLSLIFLILVLIIDRFNILGFKIYQRNFWIIFYLWPVVIVFFLRILAELNRTPFDFSEGESELVSGFNVEYRRGGFVLIFISEYARILFIRFIFSIIFLGGNYRRFIFYIKIIIISFFIIWLRGTLPRFRYDLLIYLCWIIVLPFVLNYLIIIFYFKILI